MKNYSLNFVIFFLTKLLSVKLKSEKGPAKEFVQVFMNKKLYISTLINQLAAKMVFVCKNRDHVTQSCYLLLDEQAQTFEYGSMLTNTLKYINIYISESTLLRN